MRNAKAVKAAVRACRDHVAEQGIDAAVASALGVVAGRSRLQAVKEELLNPVLKTSLPEYLSDVESFVDERIAGGQPDAEFWANIARLDEFLGRFFPRI
jgi:hypothetical protein